MITFGNKVTEQLTRLGVPIDQLGAQLSGLTDPAPLLALGELSVGYGQAALSQNRFSRELRDGRVDVQEAWANLPPSEAKAQRARFIAPAYAASAGAQAAIAGDTQAVRAALRPDRQAGLGAARALERDGVLRAAFEKKSALSVQLDGRGDGVISVAPARRRTTASAMSAGPDMSGIYAALARMDAAVSSQAAKIGHMNAADQATGTTNGQGAKGAGSAKGKTQASVWADTDVAGLPYYRAGGSEDLFRETTSTGRQQYSQGSGTSIDVQTMELKRMIDKRTQMYNLISQILSKYNQAAKNAVNNMKA